MSCVVTARDADEPDVVMAIEHATLPIAAVQFHPESILTADGDRGLGHRAQLRAIVGS